MQQRWSTLLAAEVRRRLGPPPELASWPLVSIVVPNRDGAAHLRRLLAGLVGRTDYPRFELILVDNGSSDGSLDFIRRVEAPFPISIVANPHNESFSDACNQGAELAAGELLLFLNNDVEPFEPAWLHELVGCRQTHGAGAVAATLLCPEEEHKASFRHGYGVQHRGLVLRDEEGMLGPALYGWEADPLDERLGEDIDRALLAAACLLVERGAFERVGSFSHGYVYGAEDVDLCFKLGAAGLPVVCSGRSLAIHHPASTRRAAPFEQERARKLANRRLLWERWGPRMRREYELARGTETPLGFCLKADGLEPAQRDCLDTLRDEVARRGYRCLLLEDERVDDSLGLNYDVAVHLRGPNRYIPKPGQLNVLCAVGHLDALTEIERSRYDLATAWSGEDPAALLVDAATNRIEELAFPLRIGTGEPPLTFVE